MTNSLINILFSQSNFLLKFNAVTVQCIFVQMNSIKLHFCKHRQNFHFSLPEKFGKSIFFKQRFKKLPQLQRKISILCSIRDSLIQRNVCKSLTFFYNFIKFNAFKAKFSFCKVFQRIGIASISVRFQKPCCNHCIGNSAFRFAAASFFA